MPIDISKGSSIKTKDKNKSNKIQEMTVSIKNICYALSADHDSFDLTKTFELVKVYVENYDRLLYAEISNHCYNQEAEMSAKFLENLNSLVEYVLSEAYQSEINCFLQKNEENNYYLYKKTKRIIIKLYDNVNLACTQMSSLKRSEDELKQAVNKELEPFTHEVIKDMSSQLITLVGIFTAIAFLVFGGFDSLMSIFSQLPQTGIAKIIMVSSLWGLVISNGLFILLSCIERLVQKQTIDKLTITSNISQWANLILITIFLGSSWVNYIDNRNLGGILIRVLRECEDFVCVGGLLLIVVMFFVCAFILDKNNKKGLVRENNKKKQKSD